MGKAYFTWCWKAMGARQDVPDAVETPMNRILRLHDLIFLGLASMLGLGVYVMVGNAAKTVGPLLMLSFVLAGIVALLSAFCYAEFAGRVPGTGSAYTYAYVTMGEFIAFVLGWSLLLEFVIGTACLARGLSGYLNAVFEGRISAFFLNYVQMSETGGFFSAYPDFLALGLMVLFSLILSMGLKISSGFNMCFVSINLLTIFILIIVSFMSADIKNWRLTPDDFNKSFVENAEFGEGGLVPFGIKPIFEGAASVFYAYTGFDTVAATGGEANNPVRTIPIALVLSMGMVICIYVLVSTSFSLMWPYYDQLVEAPYPYVLLNLGRRIECWIILLGATAAILGCTMASTFGMARITYSIAKDGLLPGCIGTINKRTKVPVVATLLSGFFTGCIAVFFDTDHLINLTSIGTLMAYSGVAICVLILRYSVDPLNPPEDGSPHSNIMGILFNIPRRKLPTPQTQTVSMFCIIIFTVLVCIGCCLVRLFSDDYFVLSLTISGGFFFLGFLVFIVLCFQPSSSKGLKLRVRPVPLMPIISLTANTCLISLLDVHTWLRWAIWFVIGLLIYFLFGIRTSKERLKEA